MLPLRNYVLAKYLLISECNTLLGRLAIALLVQVNLDKLNSRHETAFRCDAENHSLYEL